MRLDRRRDRHRRTRPNRRHYRTARARRQGRTYGCAGRELRFGRCGRRVRFGCSFRFRRHGRDRGLLGLRNAHGCLVPPGLDNVRRLFLKRFVVVTFGGEPLYRAVEAKLAPDLQSDVLVDRAGVGLLLGDAEPRQEVEYRMWLYFELPRQLINSDFLHRKRTTKLSPVTRRKAVRISVLSLGAAHVYMETLPSGALILGRSVRVFYRIKFTFADRRVSHGGILERRRSVRQSRDGGIVRLSFR